LKVVIGFKGFLKKPATIHSLTYGVKVKKDIDWRTGEGKLGPSNN
jgi:hypothetical protein